MKLQANKHSSDWAIEIGDWVYLKLQPYCQLLVKDSQNQKLSTFLWTFSNPTEDWLGGLQTKPSTIIKNSFCLSYFSPQTSQQRYTPYYISTST